MLVLVESIDLILRMKLNAIGWSLERNGTNLIYEVVSPSFCGPFFNLAYLFQMLFDSSSAKYFNAESERTIWASSRVNPVAVEFETRLFFSKWMLLQMRSNASNCLAKYKSFTCVMFSVRKRAFNCSRKYCPRSLLHANEIEMNQLKCFFVDE